MCVIIFRSIYRRVKNRNGPQQPKRSKEQKQPKEVALCEHQLVTTNVSNIDTVLNEKAPDAIHQRIPDAKRGPKHCPECIAEEKRARIYRWKLILSLLIPNMMATMDLTITATALPTIASHFSKSSSFLKTKRPC
jgi:hypothetical protein